MTLLTKALKEAWGELVTPGNLSPDDQFEAYVRTHLFPEYKYVLLSQPHGYSVTEPGFKFRSIDSGREFFVAAKYLSNFDNGKIEWCQPYELERYKELNKNTPVYIVIGVGRLPDAPEQIFLIPAKYMNYPTLFRSFLRQYEVKGSRFTYAGRLQSLLRYV